MLLPPESETARAAVSTPAHITSADFADLATVVIEKKPSDNT